VKQNFLGAHCGDGRHDCGLAHGACGLHCGEANRPAMLTLQAPRARARLRLNVKGFNMGDISPWQTDRSRAANRIGRLALPLMGRSKASLCRRIFPNTRGLAALPFR
jgi:hypothetical protein